MSEVDFDAKTKPASLLCSKLFPLVINLAQTKHHAVDAVDHLSTHEVDLHALASKTIIMEAWSCSCGRYLALDAGRQEYMCG